MFRANRRIHGLVLALAASLAAGCGLPPTRAEFQENIAKDNREIARTMVALRDTLKPLTDGKLPDAGQVRNAYQDVVKAMDDAQADAKGMMLPPASGSAEGLLDAYKTYLDAEKDVVDGPVQQIVTEVEKPAGDASVDDRRNFINARLQEIGAKERENFAPLTAAQKAYDDEHNFQGEPFSQYIADQKKK